MHATDVLWLLGHASMQASLVSVFKHITAYHFREQQDRQGVHPKSMRHDKVLLARIAGDAQCAFQWQQAHSYIHSAVPQ